jgi:hypothetical protein
MLIVEEEACSEEGDGAYRSSWVVVVTDIVQIVSILNLQLGQDSTSSEASAMEREIVSEDGAFANNFELLDELVDVLVPATDATPNTEHLWILIVYHTAWNLHIQRVFSNVSIISFNALSFL